MLLSATTPILNGKLISSQFFPHGQYCIHGHTNVYLVISLISSKVLAYWLSLATKLFVLAIDGLVSVQATQQCYKPQTPQNACAMNIIIKTAPSILNLIKWLKKYRTSPVNAITLWRGSIWAVARVLTLAASFHAGQDVYRGSVPKRLSSCLILFLWVLLKMYW